MDAPLSDPTLDAAKKLSVFAENALHAENDTDAIMYALLAVASEIDALRLELSWRSS